MLSAWTQDEYIHAYRFAAEAHRGQLFPGTDLPYLVHVTLVCMEVIAAFRIEKECNERLGIPCALLHDVLEDTDRTYQQIAHEFGESVAEGVQALSKNPALPKEAQLQDSLERIRKQPHEIWMVKLADRITNLQPPPHAWTKEKISRYRQEAFLIHSSLHEASPMLAARLQQKIDAYGVHLNRDDRKA